MIRVVRGPNGQEIAASPVVASGLVGDGNRGYEYVDSGPVQEPQPGAGAAPSADSTVKELRAYAKAEGIDLGGAKRKEDILAALELDSAQEPADDDEDDDELDDDELDDDEQD